MTDHMRAHPLQQTDMAVYFDHRLQTERSGINTNVCWFSGAPVLAVTGYSETAGGSVNLFLEEGEEQPNCLLQRSCQATATVWNPTKKAVAVGWENGELLIWNETEKELYEGIPIHKAAITILKWSSNGTRLTSGDKSGLLIVWKADAKCRLQQNPLFKHTLQEPLTQIVFRPVAPTEPSMDISQLARAAVSGDESALDMFNWKKGKNNVKVSSSYGPQESLAFFVGGASGGVYYVNEIGQCTLAFSVDHPVMKLLYFDDRNILITVTNNMNLSQHVVLPEGDTKEIIKVKMSGRGDQPSVIWAGSGVLATAMGEGVIRMWDLEQEENFVLSLEGYGAYDQNERLQCLAYCENKGILSAGTNMGNVAMWKYVPPGSRRVDGEKKWKLLSPATIEGPVHELQWGSNKDILAVNTIANVFMLNENVMSAAFKHQIAVVQFGPNSLYIEMFNDDGNHDLKTDIQVKGVFTTKDALAVWNGRRVIMYEYGQDTAIRASGTFNTESMGICVYEQNVYCIEPSEVKVRTFQGTVKQLLSFTDIEGQPVCVDVCGNYLLIATISGVLKVYDLSRREAKLHNNPKGIAEVIPEFHSLLSAKVNCHGNRVSIMVNTPKGIDADHKLYCWNVELDTISYFNFESGRGEQDDFPSHVLDAQESELDTNDAERGKDQAAKDIAGRFPISHYWDPHEPKLLVCEAKILTKPVDKEQKEEYKKPSLSKVYEEGPVEIMIVSLFCTSENGMLIQDSFVLGEQFNSLLGVEVPYHYFVKKSENLNQCEDDQSIVSRSVEAVNQGGSIKLVARKIMRDFVGLESSDKTTKDAMMNFSYFLTIGNMDEAFKSIKLIKSESVWENMAKMCVKSRRLDVASVCLGNMGHAQGAKALREAMKHPELDARVAVLAVQLGLYEDAERLLKNCKRFDLLNEFYQAGGHWGKALETAEMYDRIHLRTTYYNFAKHLERKGKPLQAIPNYEKSDTHSFEVPRMLFDDIDTLEQYIIKQKDRSLHKWWAQYLESSSEMDSALQFYELAQDYLSMVRVYCYCNNMEKAAEICNETGDRAACYHIARQYENMGQVREAVHFFTRAQAYGNAIRLSKEQASEEQIMNLALLGKPDDMIEAARFYEQKDGCQDKAVMLYHKAGNFSKALDLAFRTKQFGALQLISGDLDERADPELLQRCADFFLENGQYDKAVDLLAIGKKYWEALKICMDQHVEVSEDLAEKFTPVKGEGGTDAMERIKILEAIAEVCMHQGQYHMATKKFTQAGNKMKAMKALLKSGDTEKIIFFAGVSRQKEIYIMAANYLQSLDWRKDPEIMKNIIGFYTKGRALDSLSSFYDACAQVEIDEYQNYDKALGALGEAYKCLSNAKMLDKDMQEKKLAHMKNKILLIKKFVQARRMYDTQPDEAIKHCQVLLEEPELDHSVRIGDVYGFMIEHYAQKERWKAAYSSMEEMKSKIPSANIAFYVNMRTIEAIHRALNMPFSKQQKMNGFKMNGPTEEEEEGDIVEEDVAIYNGDDV